MQIVYIYISMYKYLYIIFFAVLKLTLNQKQIMYFFNMLIYFKIFLKHIYFKDCLQKFTYFILTTKAS